MHKRVNIDILGHQFAVKTDGNEQYIQKIADYVNAKSREIMGISQTVSTLDVVIKVAINLADELFQERAARQNLYASVEEESRRLVREIQSHLQSHNSKPLDNSKEV